ncbi:MAG: DUF2911 domain-containing protein [Cyclobacteriaceae bacterium]
MKLNKIGRRILIGVGIVIMLFGAIFIYINYQNRNLSPPGSAELTNGTLTVSVNYSRPSVRGRIVFGKAENGAIQPWGQYWRLGANEPTSMTINQNVTLNGKALAKGTYQLYAVPNESSFTIGINTEDRFWGYSEPNYEMDILTTETPVIKNAHVEQHTISLQKSGVDGVDLIVTFSDVKLNIPIRLAD